MEGFDYENLATAVEQLREAARAMVAGLVQDGFTDEQARSIVTFALSNTGRED